MKKNPHSYFSNSKAAVVHWTRQLKDVLGTQDTSGLDETAGPLEEIDFWKARNQDLLGISKQLNKPSVKKITKILDIAKSSYITSFLKLAKQILVGFQSNRLLKKKLNML